MQFVRGLCEHDPNLVCMDWEGKGVTPLPHGEGFVKTNFSDVPMEHCDKSPKRCGLSEPRRCDKE